MPPAEVPDLVDERVLPCDLDSEGAIISLVMADPDAMRKVQPIVRAADFYSRAHSEIYSACGAVHQKGERVDVVRVAGYLKDNGKLALAGGMAYLTEVLATAPNTANVVAYAKTVRNKARSRDLIQACQRITSEGYAPHGDETSYLLKAGATIREITRVADRSALSSNVDALREVFLKIQKNCNSTETVTGLRTGIEAYDRLTMGLHGKQLTIVAARPGVGKSGILLQWADYIAQQGVGVACFWLEMNKEEMSQRQISQRSGVDSGLLELGKLTPEQWAKVTQAVKDISQLPMKVDDTPDLTIHQLRERALGAIDDGFHEKKPIGAIFVDYLQRFRVPNEDKRKARHEQVEDVARGMKELAKETGLPVVSAAALRRLPEGRPGKRPTMEDLRESGGIESEADNVTLIHRGGMYDSKIPESDAELIVDKIRHYGKPGIVRARWVGELTKFDNVADGG